MRRCLSFFLAAMLLFGTAVGEALPTGGGDVEQLLASMSLRDKVGQMMMPSFRVWKEMPAKEGEETPTVNITELNDQIREAIARYHFGGVILYAENCVDAEQTLRLNAALQAASLESGGLPMLIAADQEGGNVSRLGYGTVGVSNMALAATGDSANARAMARIHGEELGLVGVQVNFAPVADVNSNPNNPVIGIRSFSDDAATVSEYCQAYLAGLHDVGTIAALKHFPGHGDTDTDSHTGFPIIQRTLDELKANELIPFQAAIDAGADMVMTAHIQYPQIETQTYTSTSTGEEVCLPATMSRAILTDLLRGEMGFDGVIVSDALDMDAVAKNFSPEDTMRLTINAGVDLLLLPATKNTDLFAQMEAMVDTAIAMVEDGTIAMEEIDDSVRRILTLKKKYGLLDKTDFTVTDEQVQAAVDGVGSEANRQAAWDIAEKALTLVKNENSAFPFRVKSGENTLILFADSCASRIGTAELAWQVAAEKGIIPMDAFYTPMKHTRDNTEECLETAKLVDHVILVDRVYHRDCMDPATEDGFSTEAFDRIIAQCHEEGKPVVVVSCQLPYDAARFPEADAILLAYCSSPMRAMPPRSGEGSGYSPNLAAALCACLGTVEAKGVLPVNIPALDDAYRMTDEILFPRGK